MNMAYDNYTLYFMCCLTAFIIPSLTSLTLVHRDVVPDRWTNNMFSRSSSRMVFFWISAITLLVMVLVGWWRSRPWDMARYTFDCRDIYPLLSGFESLQPLHLLRENVMMSPSSLIAIRTSCACWWEILISTFWSAFCMALHLLPLSIAASLGNIGASFHYYWDLVFFGLEIILATLADSDPWDCEWVGAGFYDFGFLVLTTWTIHNVRLLLF